MRPAPSIDHSRVSLSADLEKHLARFEKAWQAGQPPRLIDYLPDGDDGPALKSRIKVLKELIKIDLEFRWRSPSDTKTPPKRQLLEEYLAKHPDLQQLSKVPLDLIVEEYRVRQRWGDRPKHAEFSERFSGHGDTLVARLKQVDADLSAEFTKHAKPMLPADQPTAPPEGAAQEATIDSDHSSATQDAGLPTIAGYDILEVLGRGGMGVVYKARHRKLKCLVALKMIVAGAHAGPDQLARFQAEAEAVAHLQHPNIVQIHEVGEQDGLPFFCLEFVSGGSLDRMLLGTPQDPRAAAKLVRTLARAMQEAHDAGIIHRDLKPANILLGKDGTPKITDFGLAKHLDSTEGKTQSGAIMGTPSYMAPEQAAGKIKEIGPATDVYALGAILYEMLTGRPPFKAATPMDTVMQVITEEPVPPIQLQPKLPRDLDTICLKCLHKEHHKRYASGKALADDLKHFLAGEPIQARPVGTPERMWRWCRRKPAFAAASTAAMFGVMLALVTFATAFFMVSESLDQEQEHRKKAVKLAGDNEGLAKKEKKARLDAEEGRKKAENLVLQLRFEHAFLQSQENPALGMLSTAGLLREAIALGNQPLQVSFRRHLGSWFEQVHRLKCILSHKDEIRTLSFSPDGKTLLTGSNDKTARLWEAATGEPIGLPLEHQGSVTSVAFSPDGKTIVTGSSDKTARLWNRATGKVIGQPLRHQGSIHAVAFSPDSKLVLTGSEDKTAQLWQTATGNPIGPPLQHQDGVIAVAYSRNGDFVLTGSKDKTARLWETATGKPIGSSFKHQAPVKFAALSSDAKTSLTVSANKVHLWETTTGKPLGSPMLHQAEVLAAAFSPDGKSVATGSGDKTARLWETATGNPIGPPLQHQNAVMALAFSPDGTTLLTGSADYTARLWETATARPLGSPLQHQDFVIAVAFSPDGKSVLTGSNDRTSRLWETVTSKPIGLPLQHTGRVTSVAFSPDGRTVVTKGQGKGNKQSEEPLRPKTIATAVAFSPDGKTVMIASSDKITQLLDIATGKPIGPPLQHADIVSDAVFSRDGKAVMTGSHDKTARLWETATGKPIGPPLKHQNFVTAVAICPGDRFLLTGSYDGTAQIWETATGKPVGLPLQHRGIVVAVAFSHNGETLLTGSYDNTAQLWETATGKPIGPPLLHQKEVTRVAFSPDSKTALTAVAASRTAHLWETATGNAIGEPLQHQHVVVAMSFSPDGKTVLTGSYDKTARLWETATGKSIGPALQHEDSVSSVAFSPDGKTLLTGSHDKTARLWEAATGKPIGSPLQHRSLIRAVAFGPEGKCVLTGSSDTTVHMWELTKGKLVEPPLVIAMPPSSGVKKNLLTEPFARFWETASGRPIGPPLQHQDGITSVAFSPDGKTVLTGSNDKTARQWELATGKPIGQPLQHQGTVTSVAFSPDGKTVLTGSNDKTARIWDAATGKPIGSPLEHQDGVTSVAFSPDGTTVRTADKMWRLWLAATGKTIGLPLQGVVAFSPDGKTALTRNHEKQQRLLETATGKPIGQPLQHQSTVTSAVFSPDGRTVLTGGGDNTARLWDAATGKPTGLLLQHQFWVWAVAFSPDGKTIITGSADRTARLWETATGKPIGPPLQHQDWVMTVAFSQDGQIALTGSNDKTARLWETATGRPIGPALQYQGSVFGLALNPDGKTVLTGSNDTTARLWRVPREIEGDPERILLWAQLVTGVEYESMRALDTHSWERLRRQLHESGGPPDGSRITDVHEGPLPRQDKEIHVSAGETEFKETLSAKERERVHVVRLVSSKLYMIDMQTTQFDAYLRLEDATGRILAENNAIRPGNQNARIVFMPRQDGDYRVVATSFQHRGTGDFVVTIRELERSIVAQAIAKAQNCEWAAADTGYSKFLQFREHPDGEFWFELTCLRLLAGEEIAYRQTCTVMLEQFEKHGQIRPYHLARSFSLASHGKELPRPAKLAEKEFVLNRGAFWALTESAALSYRAGDYAKAIDFVQQSQKANPNWGGQVVNWLWLAMAHYRLGQKEEARKELAKSEEWFGKHGKQFPGPAIKSLHYHDWLEAHVLIREARRMIHDSKRETTPVKEQPKARPQ
jgi:WD40 repeat protein/tetratricopeptide (TPR) repeat protein/predicted Ser/Thr protein kinase